MKSLYDGWINLCFVCIQRKASRPSNQAVYMMLDAAASGEISKLTSIFSDGMDINECDHYGRTSMHLACPEGHLHMTAYLINLRANVSGEDKNDRELNEAIENVYCNIVSILVQNGAELTQEGKSNMKRK